MIKDSNKIVWIILNAAKTISAGKHKLAEFLKGSKAKDIAHLSGLQGYGGLLWHDMPAIEGFIEQLEAIGLITRKIFHDFYSALEITEAGRKVLDEKISIELQLIRKEKPIKVGDSEKLTYELFKQGKSAEEIAEERSLAVSTIYEHMQRLIANNHISCSDVVNKEKIGKILEISRKFDKMPRLRELKEMLPEEISYAEIRCVLADNTLLKTT